MVERCLYKARMLKAKKNYVGAEKIVYADEAGILSRVPYQDAFTSSSSLVGYEKL